MRPRLANKNSRFAHKCHSLMEKWKNLRNNTFDNGFELTAAIEIQVNCEPLHTFHAVILPSCRQQYVAQDYIVNSSDCVAILFALTDSMLSTCEKNKSRNELIQAQQICSASSFRMENRIQMLRSVCVCALSVDLRILQ